MKIQKPTDILFVDEDKPFTGWLCFEEARRYSRSLNLNSYKKWMEYGRRIGFSEFIPMAPDSVYKNEWVSWSDWLGNGEIAHKLRKFLPFRQARILARKLGFKNVRQWEAWRKLKPKNIPSSPNLVYKDKGWVSWGDWLGTGSIRSTFLARNYLPFKETRARTILLGLKNKKEWVDYKKKNQVKDMPLCPDRVYAKWVSWGDWLGTGYVHCHNREYRSFDDSKRFVRRLSLKNSFDWRFFCRSGKKPKDIPANPHKVYKDEWVSMGDWLGTGVVATRERKQKCYFGFDESRNIVHKLKLQTQSEWFNFARSSLRPNGIPIMPWKVYKSKWVSMGDWLGNGNMSLHYRNKTRMTFIDGRNFSRNLGLKRRSDWLEYCKSGKRPLNLPSNPDKSYKDSEWISWDDWLVND